MSETSAILSHRVTDQNGVQVGSMEEIVGKNFVDNEYQFDLLVNGVSQNDVKISMLSLVSNLS